MREVQGSAASAAKNRKKEGGNVSHFDWEKEWFEGEEPPVHRTSWKEFAAKHPIEIMLACALGMLLLVWWGIS